MSFVINPIDCALAHNYVIPLQRERLLLMAALSVEFIHYLANLCFIIRIRHCLKVELYPQFIVLNREVVPSQDMLPSLSMNDSEKIAVDEVNETHIHSWFYKFM